MFAVFGIDPKKVKEKAHKQALAVVGKAQKKAKDTKGKTKVPAVEVVEAELLTKLLESTPHSRQPRIQHADYVRTVHSHGRETGLHPVRCVYQSTSRIERQKRPQQNRAALCAVCAGQ
ncbi:hypothetical protein [Rheinheimera sp. MM224]|uniref:hypothetical protein n=1 Tax=Rheinheimera sp. MM224 TaxID=3019969 RepID=UPI0021F88F63|nr:hypothetical protein [Rheinheimera sp. MM224]CAI3795723.1 hypothetical protein JAMGFMIE_01389 [Rheinheimera sp. MM224]